MKKTRKLSLFINSNSLPVIVAKNECNPSLGQTNLLHESDLELVKIRKRTGGPPKAESK